MNRRYKRHPPQADWCAKVAKDRGHLARDDREGHEGRPALLQPHAGGGPAFPDHRPCMGGRSSAARGTPKADRSPSRLEGAGETSEDGDSLILRGLRMPGGRGIRTSASPRLAPPGRRGAGRAREPAPLTTPRRRRGGGVVLFCLDVGGVRGGPGVAVPAAPAGELHGAFRHGPDRGALGGGGPKEATFDIVTFPTPTQQRAYDLPERITV